MRVAAGGHAHLDRAGVCLGLFQQILHGGDAGLLVGKQHFACAAAKYGNHFVVLIAVLAGAGWYSRRWGCSDIAS